MLETEVDEIARAISRRSLPDYVPTSPAVSDSEQVARLLRPGVTIREGPNRDLVLQQGPTLVVPTYAFLSVSGAVPVTCGGCPVVQPNNIGFMGRIGDAPRPNSMGSF